MGLITPNFILTIVLLIFAIYREYIRLKDKQRTLTIKQREDETWNDAVLKQYAQEIKDLTRAFQDVLLQFKMFTAEQAVVNKVNVATLEAINRRVEGHEHTMFQLAEKLAQVRALRHADSE